MERFEYKVLGTKTHGVFQEIWFDGDENLGKEITAELLNRYGAEGWEVCGTMRAGYGFSIFLKRRKQPLM